MKPDLCIPGPILDLSRWLGWQYIVNIGLLPLELIVEIVPSLATHTFSADEVTQANNTTYPWKGLHPVIAVSPHQNISDSMSSNFATSRCLSQRLLSFQRDILWTQLDRLFLCPCEDTKYQICGIYTIFLNDVDRNMVESTIALPLLQVSYSTYLADMSCLLVKMTIS